MASALEQVQAAIDEGAHQRALELALAEWNRALAPEIAAVAQREAARALETYEAPPARRNDEFQLAWLERAKVREPLATGWLASTLGKKLSVEADHFGILDRDYARKKYAALFERLEALKLHAPSPLIAEAVATLVAEAPYSAWDQRSGEIIYRPLIDLLVACRDVRQLPLLRQLLETPRAPRAATREVLAMLLPKAIEALAAVDAGRVRDGHAGWRELLPGVGESAAGGQAFLDAVAEKLEDDERRLVYADWLTERGDPRGEFITIQVREAKGVASDAEKKRARALLKAHEEQWLGDLSRVFSNCTFERGFLDSATLAQNAAATPEVWTRAAADPRLRTLRVLDKGRGNTAHLIDFTLSAETLNLRGATVPNPRVLEQLCSGPVRQLQSFALAKLPTEAQLRLVAASPSLPRLEVILFTIRDEDCEALIDRWSASGIAKKLRWAHLDSTSFDQARALKAGLFDRGLVDKLSFSAFEFFAELSREGERFALELEDRYGTNSELAALAAGAQRVTIRSVDRGVKGDWQNAAAKLDAAGVEVALGPLEAG